MSRSEDMFLRLSERPLVRSRPSSFADFMKVHRTDLGSAWLKRRGIEEAAVLDGGWGLLMAALAMSIVIGATGIGLLGLFLLPFVLIAVLLVPIIAASYYLNAPEAFAAGEERAMLRESPAAIGRMTMSMHVQPSLERAVVFASRGGEDVLDARMSEAMWSSLTRVKSNLGEAMLDLSASLSEADASLRQALHLVISATCERTQEGMHRLLDKANVVALAGVRDSVDRYASSLSVPTMILFSLGTLLPIMLFSVLPLLSISTAMTPDGESQAVPLPYLAFLLLVVLPGAAFAYSWSVLSKNPLGLTGTKDAPLSVRDHLPFIAIWIIGTALAALFIGGDWGPFAVAGVAVLAPCAYVGWVLKGTGMEGKGKRAMEAEAISALFLIGNRMVSGSTLESALESVASSKQSDLAVLFRSLLHRTRTTGMSFDQAIAEDATLRSVSPMLENAYITVAQCSRQDPRYSGQVALNLAQMLTDLNTCRGKIEEKLRGIVDMMKSTGMVFAPIVLGVTGSLFMLISDQVETSGGMANDIALITGLYIGELSFLVSFFTVLVMGERSWKGIAAQYATRTPVAFAIFVGVSLICRTGLSALL